MENWNEIRTAAAVARLETISAAALALGVHRATVTRHIDTLEQALGAKLFQRHARGFTPTELGQELLRIAAATETQFGELARLARGSEAQLSGEIVVTSLDVLVPSILPRLAQFQREHPDMALHLISSDRKLKLEYGEADMAFRIGPKPGHPDNVVLVIGAIEIGVFAAPSYIERHGAPMGFDDLSGHQVIGTDASAPNTPYLQWLRDEVPSSAISFRTNSVLTMWEAVAAGLGVGFHPVESADAKGLVSVGQPRADWHETIWAVTHVDLHRTAKVQAFVKAIKAGR
ncbi:MAG: LysR family transcriptional regulator [Devosiaceae bacterium]|nr:LysR family transcriptional regulator [Devosiaceae bacterium MH13]